MAGDSETASYSLTYRLNASAKAVRAVLVDAGDIMRYTRSRAVSEPVAGGSYSIFDGSIVGKYEEVSDGRIVLSWRFRTWDEGVWSRVTLTLIPKDEGTTVVKLSHVGIPMCDKYGNSGQEVSARQGWKERIFGGIKAMIGIGMEEEEE